MDAVMLPAAGTVLGMIRWRLDLLERALREAPRGCPGLAEAAAAARTLRVTAELAERLHEEGYAARCAEEPAERALRGCLHPVRAAAGAVSGPA